MVDTAQFFSQLVRLSDQMNVFNNDLELDILAIEKKCEFMKARIKNAISKPKMEIFRQFQKNIAIMGIDSRSAAQNIPLNARNFSALILLALPIGLQCVYLNKVASIFQEYIEFIKIIIAMWTGTTAFAAIIWNMSKLFRYIDSLEATINKSE